MVLWVLVDPLSHQSTFPVVRWIEIRGVFLEQYKCEHFIEIASGPIPNTPWYGRPHP
jgi:hypothetical protein